MPMSIVTEGLADSRPEFRSWRAIMMGPLLMAGAERQAGQPSDGQHWVLLLSPAARSRPTTS